MQGRKAKSKNGHTDVPAAAATSSSVKSQIHALPTLSSSSSSSSPSLGPTKRPRAHSFGFRDDGLSSNPLELDTPLPFWSKLCCNSGRGSLSWTGLGIVCFALACASLGIHLLLDTLGEKLEAIGGGSIFTTLGSIAVLLALVAVPLTHGVVGVRKNGPLSYTFWQPFVGGLKFVLLQVLAWTLWTVTLLAGVYGVWIGGKKVASGWYSAVGIGGVVSQVLVLVSLHFFVSNASSNQAKKVAQIKAERARAHRLKLKEQRKQIKEAVRGKIKKVVTELEDTVESVAKAVATSTDAIDDAAPATSTATPAASTSFWPWGRFAMKLTFLLLATLSLVLALFVESISTTSPSRTASLQSLLTSAILLAVPITHLLARRSLTDAGYLLFQPFKGGKTFVIIQAIAWTLWTLAFVSAGLSFFLVAVQHQSLEEEKQMPSGFLRIPWLWLSNLITSAGIGGILSQALVLLSLKYFDSKLSRKIEVNTRVIEMVRREEEQSARGAHIDPSEVFELAAQALASPAASLHARLMNASPSPPADAALVEGEESVSTESEAASSSSMKRGPSGLNIHDTATALGSTPIPSPSTPASHRLTEAVEEVEEAPVVLPNFAPVAPLSLRRSDSAQHAADVLQLADIANSAAMSMSSLMETESPDLVTHLTSEGPFTLAQLTFEQMKQAWTLQWLQFKTMDWTAVLREALFDLRSLATIGCFYMIPIVGAVLTFVPLTMLYTHYPWPWYMYSVYGSFLLLYASTYRNRPSVTGARSWSAVRDNKTLWGSVERYFNGTIVPLGSLSEAQGPYIFGFHPHGIYPMTCFWATRCDTFHQKYPGLMIDICGASIMFHAPVLRDIVSWCGGREVSGTSIRMALQQKRSILLVPGGQREMRHSIANPNVLTLVTRHRGFIRMAIEHGVPLVPVLSIGETMLLSNVHAPRMQAYTLRRIGFGFPIWPYGRWYSPLPNPHPVVVVFGQPIPVPHTKEPSIELIEQIHQAYYQQLQQMFLAHRHMIPGFENSKLVYTEE